MSDGALSVKSESRSYLNRFDCVLQDWCITTRIATRTKNKEKSYKKIGFCNYVPPKVPTTSTEQQLSINQCLVPTRKNPKSHITYLIFVFWKLFCSNFLINIRCGGHSGSNHGTQGGPLQCSLEPQQGEDPEEGTKEGPLPATYRSITQVLKLKINSHWAPYGVGSIIKSATCQSTLQLSYRTYHREVIFSFAEID